MPDAQDPDQNKPAISADQDTVQQRFQEHQKQVADQERANRIKAQNLIQRERKLEDEQRILQQERKMLEHTHLSLKSSRRRRSAFMLPLLLVAAIAAGMLAYRNIEQQQKYFDQVTTASKNIDTLAKLLSVTQDEVVLATSSLSTKQVELERTKSMLDDLKSTTDQLYLEIRQLKGDSYETAEDKSALFLSADNLSEQLATLKAQLEDKYLTNDINEVYIEYQENDLRKARQQIQDQEDMLARKDAQIESLRSHLVTSDSAQP